MWDAAERRADDQREAETLDAPSGEASTDRAALIATLNARYRHASAVEILQAAVRHFGGRLALVSSFGAESAALLHLIAQVDAATPVLFLDTQKHFSETLAHRDALIARLGLTDVRSLAPKAAEVEAEDPQGDLNQTDPDACCALRKTRPLDTALGGFDAWITGRKRFQNAQRLSLPVFELDADGRVKINPLANWAPSDIDAYLDDHDLPRHPLVAQNYRSIGCAPCTTPVAPGEDDRAGRWRGKAKTECGIHITDEGQVERTGPQTVVPGPFA